MENDDLKKEIKKIKELLQKIDIEDKKEIYSELLSADRYGQTRRISTYLSVG